MYPFLAVVKKELGSVLRDRTIVIAILLQLFIASFSSALLMGMLALYDPDTIVQFGGASIRVGIVNQDLNSENADQLTHLMVSRGLGAVPFAALEDAKRAFAQGWLQAIIILPENRDVLEIKLILPESQVESSLIRLVIQDPLKQFENALRVQRGVDLRYTGLKGSPSTSFEFVYSVILPILMFFPAFVAGGMVIDSISEEVEGNTLPTLLSAPLLVNDIVYAKVASALVLAAVQCAAWLGLLRINQIQVQNSGWVVILAVIVAGILSAAAGIIAVILQDRERSQFTFSLFLLAAAGASYLLDLSPVQTISRLAVGDFYTDGWDVAVFAVILTGLGLGLSKLTRRLLAK